MLPNAPRPDTDTSGAPGGAAEQAVSQSVLPKIVVPDVVTCVPSGTTTFVDPNSTPTCTVDSPGCTCTVRLPGLKAGTYRLQMLVTDFASKSTVVVTVKK